eukprot:1596597-Amphidinium_carterae.1
MMTRDVRDTPQKKQGDVITSFYNVKIGNYHAASSSTTEKLKRTPRTSRRLHYVRSDTKGAYDTNYLTTL